MVFKPASDIWRDFITPGVPTPGTEYKPSKGEIRDWGAYLETLWLSPRKYNVIPGLGSGVDCSPGLNDLIDEAVATHRPILLDFGIYTCHSKLKGTGSGISQPIYIKGVPSSVLFRHYNGASDADPFIGVNDGVSNCRFEQFEIYASAGTAGAAFNMKSTASLAPQVDMVGVKISTVNAGVTWGSYPVHIDGRAHASGYRTSTMRDCHIFGGPLGSVLLWDCIAFNFIGGGTYRATGLGDLSGLFNIAGQNNNGCMYINVDSAFIDKFQLSGPVKECSFRVGSTSEVKNTAAVSNCLGSGYISGTLENNWTTSKWFRPNFATP